jgi:transposase-like protein
MFKWSKLSGYRVKKIMDCFCLDLTATQTAGLLKLNRKTVNALYNRFRLLIRLQRMSERRQFQGVVEVDESYFGASRVRGRALPRLRGRGTAKQPVFGIFERKGEVYTEIIGDCSQATLRAVIRGRIDPQSVICSDGWPGYDGLVDVGYDRHVRINKKKSFTRGRAHINGIEAFWSFTKRRLARFNGVKANFDLHLKECEWRYKKSSSTLQKNLLTFIKKPTNLLV